MRLRTFQRVEFVFSMRVEGVVGVPSRKHTRHFVLRWSIIACVYKQNQTKTSGGVTQWGGVTLAAWSRTQQSVSLSSAEAELYALTTEIAEGVATKHLWKELDMK